MKLSDRAFRLILNAVIEMDLGPLPEGAEEGCPSDELGREIQTFLDFLIDANKTEA